ncbi:MULTISPECIES: septum site-determining protein MinC [Psychrilyobacter]|uniref:Probable septum site-determining protein MinC n=1 Tax=Psychrilyobacter piezotolerans TaxID=2293438 RepID=A0ABX9KL80_9FUSO|nr:MULTISPECIES: septum site-determining protein MinC [Psychrilyobacter]MCS5421481.1 septum site-determining protein MinC [Psychrilyobacter sp. S5]NDI76543.1 septum site-determining protein MinC [Psychrilyobacter piezotolerans]RDE66134.1 septum site-determining protein MinC [Psychrilyobacter sp. S5]REI43312.1 septum site-determining protein MinC [Psychrilyobacter piezotolerans]
MGNNVIFKGSNGKLVIILNPAIPFQELKDHLLKKLKQSRQLFMGYEAVIEFKGREIDEEEELELLNIIDETVDMNILFVTDRETLPLKEVEKMTSIVKEGITKFHLGTLRSGEILEYPGNIVILGDVNPGSIVKAEGNIIVMGTLNGVAHAGIKGNDEAFIVASNMNPFQLKIDEVLFKNYSSNILFRSKQIMRNKNNIAYLRNNILIIDKLTRKSLKNIVTT